MVIATDNRKLVLFLAYGGPKPALTIEHIACSGEHMSNEWKFVLHTEHNQELCDLE